MEDVNDPDLSALEEIKSFRTDAARGNHLSMDKTCSSAQTRYREPCRRPTKKGQRKIVRVAKYLKGFDKQRIRQKFKFETLDARLAVHTDSHWARCRSSRKSMSA